jgi:hypothetical protein
MTRQTARLPRLGSIDTLRRSLLLFLATMMATLVTGCPAPTDATRPAEGGGGQNNGSHGGNRPNGIYTLHTIDGADIPVYVHQGPWFDAPNHHFYNRLVIQVTRGIVNLSGDGFFQLSLSVALDKDGVKENAEANLQGRWKLEGETVTITLDGGQTGTATLRNGTFTIAIDYLGKGKDNMYTFTRD